MDALIGLIGVIIGFALTTGWDRLKTKIARVESENAIVGEIFLNQRLIEGKRDSVRNMITRLKNGSAGLLGTIPFATGAYDRGIDLLRSDLSDDQAMSLHFIREYYRTVDARMASFLDDIRRDLPMKHPEEISKMYQDLCLDILQNLECVEQMSEQYLSGKYSQACSRYWNSSTQV